MTTTQRPITNDLDIKRYLHCGKCIEEWKAGVSPEDSPATYARFSVGWTVQGLQVWCERHQCNVVHIDFEGQKHPANTTAPRKPEAE